MVSFGFLLRIRPGMEQEYKRRHDELWPEMHDVMSKHGINMVIYRNDLDLFIYATAPSMEDWKAVDAHPVTPRWDKYMSDVLETNPDGTAVAKELPQMFCFGSFV